MRVRARPLVVVLLLLLDAGAGLVVSPLVHRSASPSLAYAPARRLSSAPLCASQSADDRFAQMRRADDPLEEEVRAMQAICIVLGILVRPGGSNIIGGTLGYFSGTMLVNAGGTTGLWAREIGWQTAQFASGVADGAHLRAARAKVAEWQNASAPLLVAAFAEVRAVSLKVWSASEVTALRTRVASRAALWWASAVAWASANGLAARLQALWTASRLGASIAHTLARAASSS